MSFLQKFLAEVFETASSKVATVAVAEPAETTNELEKAVELQPAGELQSDANGRKHGSGETSGPQATPAQQVENSAERLAAWERGEWVTIPNTAEALEIYQAIEIEQTARRRRLFVVAEELSKCLNTIDQINQDSRPDDYNFALSVLRSRVEDARPWVARGNA